MTLGTVPTVIKNLTIGTVPLSGSVAATSMSNPNFDYMPAALVNVGNRKLLFIAPVGISKETAEIIRDFNNSYIGVFARNRELAIELVGGDFADMGASFVEEWHNTWDEENFSHMHVLFEDAQHGKFHCWYTKTYWISPE